MSSFIIKGTAASLQADGIIHYASRIKEVQQQINTINNNLSFKLKAREQIGVSLRSASEEIGDSSVKMKLLGDTLNDVIMKYSKTEAVIKENAGGFSSLAAAEASSSGTVAGDVWNWFTHLLGDAYESAVGFFNDVVGGIFGNVMRCLEFLGVDINAAEKRIFDFIAPLVTPLLGFTRSSDEDYYYTGEHSIQRLGGFCDLYDHLGGLLGMELDTEVTTFIYGDKEYRIQLWKGNYGFSNAYGGEIGIYYRDAAEAMANPYSEGDSLLTLYECVSEEDELPLYQEIYDKKTDEVLISNDTKDYAKNGDHYWNLTIQTESGYTAEDIGTRGQMEVSDPGLRQAMIEAMNAEDNLSAKEEMGQDGSYYVVFKWDK